ncbi:hypothetical protein B0H66DRAFT_504209 [Apodospora peruviana]|uniref:Mtf2-like C-terminal domain-containing protein n=1 Tax=Apodospora peruviana TaxID=516989 RepID=A0AAE0M0D6_9PEZI|nr:hypothetical protein B0H66DRAFT_504209 [Apodospora peruviana]
MSSTTLLPFLYQTRTLQRFARAPRISTPAFQTLFHTSTRAHYPRGPSRFRGPKPSTDVIPFEIPPPEEAEGLEPGHQTTITPLEREAFDRIFEEIAARGKMPATASFQEEQPREEPEPAPAFLGNAVGAVANKNALKGFGSYSPLGELQRPNDINRALLRFPPSLRKAARMAMGVMEGERQDSNNDAEEGVPEFSEESDIDMLTSVGGARKKIDRIKVTATRQLERDRVEGKMRASKTDFELWDVMEEEVFSMVDRLGIRGDDNGVPETAASSPKPKRGRKSTTKASKTELSMTIHGPLYPGYLLYGLRMMDQSFTRSSPLALNVLPRIKELGLMSFVLGVSTPLYNTLAEILWYRYQDATAVVNLLEEMRHAGLYCNPATLDIVTSIQKQFEGYGRGDSGPFLKELVSLPEYEYALKTRMRHWNNAIQTQIQEREASRV